MATQRTSEQVWHQVSWDPRLDPARFVLGVDVHGEDPARVRLPEFVPGGDIPWHRVVFVEADGVPCWDRAGLDTIDALARSGQVAPRILRGPRWEARAPHRWDGVAWQAAPARSAEAEAGEPVLRVLTWNVLWDRFDAELLRSEERWPLIVDRLMACDADVVALQEVRAPLHARILEDPRVRDGWWVSHGLGHTDIGRADLLLLARVPLREVAVHALGPHKAALAAVVHAAASAVIVVTTHLTSDHARGAAETRARELAAISAALAGLDRPTVLLGDLNLHDEGPVDGWVDAWTALRDPEPTFDPVENPLAALSSLTGQAARLDRVLLAGDVTPVDAALLGRDADPGLGHPSDHWAVAATLRFGADPRRFAGPSTRRSAIAWLPSVDARPALDAVRSVRDPDGHARWPPHVNLAWPAPRESDLDAATPAIVAAVAGAVPFRSRLSELGAFPGAAPTHHLRPDNPEAWRALYRRLCAHLPTSGEGALSSAYTPHLTLARGGAPPVVAPVDARVDRLALLTRRGDAPFAVRAWLGLGSADPIGWVPEPACSDASAPEPTPWVDAVARVVGDRAAVALVGSAALGTALTGADVDLLVLAPSHDPGAVRRRLVDALTLDAAVLVRKVGLDGLRLRLDGRSVDLVFVPLGDVPVAAALDPEIPPEGLSEPAAQAVGAVRDLAALRARVRGRERAFVGLCRWVKAWARARGLDDPALGGVEGLGWAVLAAEALGDAVDGDRPDSDRLDVDLAKFVARWASWDLVRGVGGPDRLASPGDRWGLPVYTPAAPVRPITRRAHRVRFETALISAWEAVDAGIRAAELLRPPPWHRLHAEAVVVVADDDAGLGVARGRALHLLEALPEPVAPLRVRGGFALGLARGVDPDMVDAVVDAWAAHPELVRSRVRASRVPTDRIDG